MGLKGSDELCDVLALKIKALGVGVMPQSVKRKRKDLAPTPPETTLNVERSIMGSSSRRSAEGQEDQQAPGTVRRVIQEDTERHRQNQARS